MPSSRTCDRKCIYARYTFITRRKDHRSLLYCKLLFYHNHCRIYFAVARPPISNTQGRTSRQPRPYALRRSATCAFDIRAATSPSNAEAFANVTPCDSL
mmetsp:Transcript_2565/g.9319  ORF Transcript_2565/g.9319 Transcript_2565/m.9319 type:complete len:99 (+) Transcript_2565:1645-1941(+)